MTGILEKEETLTNERKQSKKAHWDPHPLFKVLRLTQGHSTCHKTPMMEFTLHNR
jgi:hypothetical protein